MSARVEGVLPFWLDRPDEEALEIALEVRRAGLGTLWIGEMATYDAVALATAIGHRVAGLGLKIGPLAVGVRSPVAMALAVSSVATLTDSEVGLALGASSPVIVSGWHDREWAHSASRMREAITCLREILSGEPSNYDGRHVRTHGFRLRRPQPDTQITVAAFGPAMTRVAARHADEVVLNLVPPQHVSAVRATVDAEAAAAGRSAPDLAVWVPVALDPGDEARAQLAGQLAVYLGVPGYGEMFGALGFSELVDRARRGARRSELARQIPFELLEQIGAVGAVEDVVARIRAYHDAGADVVGIVPSTAEDPGGRRVLTAVSERFEQRLPVSSRQNVASLRAILETWSQEAWTLEAWQRGELMDMSLLDPDVIYEDTVLPDHAGEEYRGHEGVIRAAKRWVEPSEWVLVELEQIVGARDRLVSIHRVRSKARHTGIEFETPLAYLWTFRDGKIVHFQSFLHPEQAIEAAGLSE